MKLRNDMVFTSDYAKVRCIPAKISFYNRTRADIDARRRPLPLIGKGIASTSRRNRVFWANKCSGHGTHRARWSLVRF